MSSVRRALVLSIAERYVLIAISLLGNILVARLLTPEEIGIYSVSLAVIGIAQVLRDFGVGSFLIQEKDLRDEHIRTAFGFSLLIGGVLFVVVFFAAPLAGSFYGEQRMVETMRISALNFLVLPFCTISVALLRRALVFNRLVVVTLLAAVVGFATTISLAYSGFGANSMAIGAVATNIATGAGAWLARSDRKLLLPSFSEWRSVLKFGSQSSAASIVTTISMDINDLALGKILGFAPVAIISRAQGLMNLFHRDLMTAIRNVAYPAFAKTHREGGDLEPRYIASVTAVTVIAWPFYGFAGFFALEILRLMFGPQWDEAAPLVMVFCLAGAVASTSSLITSAMMAVGRVDLVTKSEMLFQPLRAIAIVAAAIIFKSLMACALTYCIAFFCYLPFIYAFKQRCIPNDYQKLFENLLASAKVTLGTLTLPTILALHVGFGRTTPLTLSILIFASALAVLGWIVSVTVFKHPVLYDPLFKHLTRKLPGFAQERP